MSDIINFENRINLSSDNTQIKKDKAIVIGRGDDVDEMQTNGEWIASTKHTDKRAIQ